MKPVNIANPFADEWGGLLYTVADYFEYMFPNERVQIESEVSENIKKLINEEHIR